MYLGFRIWGLGLVRVETLGFNVYRVLPNVALF